MLSHIEKFIIALQKNQRIVPRFQKSFHGLRSEKIAEKCVPPAFILHIHLPHDLPLYVYLCLNPRPCGSFQLTLQPILNIQSCFHLLCKSIYMFLNEWKLKKYTLPHSFVRYDILKTRNLARASQHGKLST